MTKDKWVWMPHPGHFIGGHDCRFHLCTWVGEWIVSTVGEYLPDSNVRETMARSRGIILEGRGDARLMSWMNKVGYEEIGFGRKFETMVFPAEPDRYGSTCCPYRASEFSEQDVAGYNDAGAAFAGHNAMCEKWAAIPAAETEVK